MRKQTQMYVIFAIMLILGLFQLLSGFLMWSGINLLALTRQELGDLHNGASVALVVVIIIHLVLNWKWIVSVTKSYFNNSE
jgi:membrane protein implicated in regulation of membrane protease activity